MSATSRRSFLARGAALAAVPAVASVAVGARTASSPPKRVMSLLTAVAMPA